MSAITTSFPLAKWQEYGFPSSIWEKYPDFVNFIHVNNLHHMLLYYQKNDRHPENHMIKLENAEPYLFVQGVYMSWKEIRLLLPNDSTNKLQGYFYTWDQGLVPYDASDWQELRPIRQGMPTGKYFLHICSAVKTWAKNMFNGIHSYVEITDPDGRVYNCGIWSTAEIENGGASYGYATVQANVMSPDCYEFMGKRVEIYKTPVSLSLDEGKHLLQKLQSWKQEGLPFNWLRDNCSTFAVNVAAEANVSISINRSLIGAILPEKINQAIESFVKRLPSFLPSLMSTLIKIIFFVPIVIINSVRCLFLGATKGIFIGPQGQKRKIAIIGSASDFLWQGVSFNMPSALLSWQKLQPETIIWP